jgi:hypothetical protein
MHKEQYYLAMFGSDARFNVKYTLTPAGISLALEEKWMIMPDIGFLLAQKYKHTFVLLARHIYSETYFLLECEYIYIYIVRERERERERWPTRYVH